MTTVLYVGGIGRSGTTLFGRVLQGLPGYTALGEVSTLWQGDRLPVRSECACGERLPDCPTWGPIGSALGGWESFARSVPELRAALRHRNLWALTRGSGAQVQKVRSVLAELYGAARDVTKADVLVDQSKLPPLYLALRDAPGLDVRLVHMVRDGRAVARSWGKSVTFTDREVAAPTGASPALAAALWSGWNLALEVCALGTRRPAMQLRYEDFVSAPAEAMRRVVAFAGAPVDVASVLEPDGAVKLERDHALGGNPMRELVGTVPLTLDDDWRSALSARDRIVVSTLTAPGLVRYRYAAGGRR